MIPENHRYGEEEYMPDEEENEMKWYIIYLKICLCAEESIFKRGRKYLKMLENEEIWKTAYIVNIIMKRLIEIIS